jgi:choline dehydrogenase-like flavoprotein
MAYTRGHPGDYDRWERDGATGWSFKNVLRYFKRTETWEGGESELRGGSGPVGTQWARSMDPLYPAWLEAARLAGWPVTDDYNGPQPVGFGRSQYTIRNGRRCSAAAGYLRPAEKRPNLTITTHAHTTRVLLEGTRATGIEYLWRGRLQRAMADREVILASGAFGSPQILMLSGIGPAAHLKSHGITTVADLPVGQNLQDHLAPLIVWSRPTNTSTFRKELRLDRIAVSMVRAQLTGTGAGTVVPGGLHAFIKSRPELEVPDIEFMFRGAPPDADVWFPGVRKAYDDGFGIRPCLLHPESRGEVLLASADPLAAPRIRFNFLSRDNDINTLRTGFKIGRDVAGRQPLDPYRGVETDPGAKIQSDAEIDAWIRRTVTTADHPACTARMGSDERAVVDPELCVRGIERLRVVDAAVMPDLISAHLNSAVLMIAEKASDMILHGEAAGATTEKRGLVSETVLPATA